LLCILKQSNTILNAKNNFIGCKRDLNDLKKETNVLNLCLQEAVSEEEEEREEYQLIKSRSKLSFTMSGGEEVITLLVS
jgi:hypothetical protein